MRAIIIGAGPVSKPKKSQPRAFLKLCGLPLLKRTLYLLRAVEIREVMVLLKLRDKLLEEENQNSGKKNQLPGPRNTEKAEWFTLFNDLPRRTQADCLDISQTASYDLELRRVVKPFWYRIASEEDLKVAKKKLIGETQKKLLMLWPGTFTDP